MENIDFKKINNQLRTGKFNLIDMANIGEKCINFGEYILASKIFAKITELNKNNPATWCNLGVCLLKLHQYEDAENIFLHSLNINEKYYPSLINLCSVYQAIKNHKKQLEFALKAVEVDMKSAMAFNNLSTALSDNGLFKESYHALETARILEPNSFEVNYNLSKIASRTGDFHKAIQILQDLLVSNSVNRRDRLDLLKYSLSEELLRVGDLETAWKLYDFGLSNHLMSNIGRHPRRQFDVPQWNGESLNEHQTLMVWREQGIGDQVLLSSLLNNLIFQRCNVIIESELRLISIFKRSFPSFTIRSQTYLPELNFKSLIKDYDYHIPMGSLAKYYLNSEKDFVNCKNYLVPDAILKDKFKNLLCEFNGKKKIGISWRSGKLDPLRNLDYTSLLDWKLILSDPEAVFINLQYGECENELIEIENLLNIKIIRWTDLDLTNDMESVVALISNVDLVVSIATNALWLAGAQGIPGVLIARKDWQMLGQDTVFPWFSSIKMALVSPELTAAHALGQAKNLIDDFFLK